MVKKGLCFWSIFFLSFPLAFPLVAQEEDIALAIRYEDKIHVIRKTVFEEEVRGLWQGNAASFARWFILDKILDIEIDLEAQRRLSESFRPFYLQRLQERRPPTRAELDRYIEKQFQDQKTEGDEEYQKQLKEYLTHAYTSQAKGEVLRFLMDQRLK